MPHRPPLVVLAAAVLASGCAAVELANTSAFIRAPQVRTAATPPTGTKGKKGKQTKKKKRNRRVRRGNQVKKRPDVPDAPSDSPPSDAPPSDAPPSDAPPSDAPPSDAPTPCHGECGPLTGLLAAHNTARASVGAPPLVWDTTLQAHATEWADQLAANACQLQHRGNSPYGENLYRITQPKPPSQVVAAWTAEAAAYNSSTHSCSAQTCGHYLQVVWSATTRVGCGMATCGQTQVWVCNYDPRGLQPGQQPF